jgi:hypothetical protein
MSKKVLKLAGRQPMLLALLVMATFTVGLLFSGWLTPTPGTAQPNQPNPQPNVEATDCGVTSIVTNCLKSGSINIIGPKNSQINCVGLPVTVCVASLISTGQVQTVTTYSNCPSAFETNNVIPTYEVTWSASIGNFSASGIGTNATFSPTDCGVSSVIFTLNYTNDPACGGTGSSTASGSFKVDGVASLTPSTGLWVDDGDGDPNTDTYLVQYGCYDTVTVAAGDCLGLSAVDLPSCWNMSGGTAIDRKNHSVNGQQVGKTVIKVTCGTSSKTVTIIVYQAKCEIYADQGDCGLGDVGHAWWNLSITPSAAQDFLLDAGCLSLAGYYDHCQPTGPGQVIFGTQTDQCSGGGVHNATGAYWWCVSFDGLQAALNYVEDLATTGSTYDVTSNNCATQAEAVEGQAGAPVIYTGITPCGLSTALNLYAMNNGGPVCSCSQ